jgi:nitroreductase
VPRDTLSAVFAAAQTAPSNCNTQPWLVHVSSGASLEALREELPRRFLAGDISMDFPYDGIYEGVYRERQHGAPKSLYDAMGIAREDREARQSQFMRNFSFFGAPPLRFSVAVPRPPWGSSRIRYGRSSASTPGRNCCSGYPLVTPTRMSRPIVAGPNAHQ